MNELYFQSLLEGVRKRKGSGSIPIYHKKSPIGKFVSKELHDSTFNDLPQKEKVMDIIRAGVHRGRIGNAKNITYSFVPDIKIHSGKKKIIHRGGTEQGQHRYRFETKNGRDVMVRVLHKASKSKKFKGKSTTSNIMFDVDGMFSRDSKDDKIGTSDAVNIMRGVSTAIRHHIKSHNPDSITFSTLDDFGLESDGRNRAKLYKYMVKKLKNKYETNVKERTAYGIRGPVKVTKFELINKRSKTRKDKTINKTKENQNGIK
jgi:hypothetical protein